jgi:hypothetical protein
MGDAARTEVMTSRSFRYVRSVVDTSLAMKYALSAGSLCKIHHRKQDTIIIFGRSFCECPDHKKILIRALYH